MSKTKQLYRLMQHAQWKTKIKVVEHIILNNMWEYYVTTNSCQKDIVQCFVVGFENELGDVYMPDLNGHILTRTKNLAEVMPAPNWNWIEEKPKRPRKMSAEGASLELKTKLKAKE